MRYNFQDFAAPRNAIEQHMRYVLVNKINIDEVVAFYYEKTAKHNPNPWKPEEGFLITDEIPFQNGYLRFVSVNGCTVIEHRLPEADCFTTIYVRDDRHERDARAI